MTDAGPLTSTVLDYVRTMEELVPTVEGPEDWAPLTEFVAVDDFERVGTVPRGPGLGSSTPRC